MHNSYDDDDGPLRGSFKFALPRNATVHFPLLLFFWTALYYGYISTVEYIMRETLHREDSKGTYDTGETVVNIGAFVLALWCLMDFYCQYSRHLAMLGIHTKFSSLLFGFIGAVNQHTPCKATIAAPDRQPENHGVHTLTRETTIMILNAMLLSLWHVSYRTKNSRDYENIVSVMSITLDNTLTGVFPNLFISQARIQKKIPRPTVMLNLISERLLAMQVRTVASEKDKKAGELLHMLLNAETLQALVSSIREQIDLIDLTDNSLSLYWTSIFVKCLGALYFLALPWVVWLTSPNNETVVTCLFVFAVVGSFLMFNIYIGDIFINPTTLHAGALQQFICDASYRAESVINAKFAGLKLTVSPAHVQHNVGGGAAMISMPPVPPTIDRFVTPFFHIKDAGSRRSQFQNSATW